VTIGTGTKYRRWDACCDANGSRRAHNKRTSAYIRRRNSQMIDEARNKSCTDCGIKFSLCVMQFDHIPGRGTKTRVLSDRVGSVKQILAELAKCDVVCANCHCIREESRRRANRENGD
jgi:hypothetical protein